MTFRYYPLHRMPLYKHDGRALPRTEAAAGSTLLLPMHQALSAEDVTRVISLIFEFGKTL